MSLARYQNLTPITEFKHITDEAGFLDVPTDWYVILTDIRGSTKAIEAGLFKEVNLIGAAGIAVIKNVIGSRNFPFVFGGDGSTCVLPSAEVEKARLPLQQLQRHSQESFSMTLRVGIVPVSAIQSLGGKIQVARYQMGPGVCIAVFRGGGLQIAEDLVKEDASHNYLLNPASNSTPPPLEDLSCRWAPITSRNGTIVSVMIQARDPARSSILLRQILDEIYPIFEAAENCPVHPGGLRLEGLFKNLRRELELRRGLSFWQKVRQVLFPAVALRIMAIWPFGSAKRILDDYLREKLKVSDYKKLDDTLRMVLDCSLKQAQDLEDLLNLHLRKKELYFGLVRSDAALMTCLVEGMGSGKHIHFIDGANGGYVMAAKQLKRQRLAAINEDSNIC